MTTAAELAGLTQTLVIGGKPYTLAPLPQEAWAEFEETIKSKRGDPTAVVKTLIQDLDRDDPMRRELLERAYKDATTAQNVTAAELDTWRQSMEGMQHCFWAQLRVHHPELTLRDAKSLWEQHALESFQQVAETLRAQFPDATNDDILEVIAIKGDAELMQAVCKSMGLPAKNLPRPSQETQPSSPVPSRGRNGSGTWLGRLVGRMRKSPK